MANFEINSNYNFSYKNIKKGMEKLRDDMDNFENNAIQLPENLPTETSVVTLNSQGKSGTIVIKQASNETTPNGNSIVQRQGDGTVRCVSNDNSDYNAVNNKRLNEKIQHIFEFERDLSTTTSVEIMDRTANNPRDIVSTIISFYVDYYDENNRKYSCLFSQDITRLIQGIGNPETPMYEYMFISGSSVCYNGTVAPKVIDFLISCKGHWTKNTALNTWKLYFEFDWGHNFFVNGSTPPQSSRLEFYLPKTRTILNSKTEIL